MKLELNLGEILTKAWQITWKFKVLWIFGILAGCTEGNSGNFNFNSGSGGRGGDGSGQLPEQFRQFQNMRPEQAIRAFLDQYVGIIVAIILVLCLLWLLFYFLGVMGRIGLIKGVGKADTGAESMTFGEIWTESLPYFWRMFGLSLLISLPAFLVAVILAVLLIVGVITAASGDVSSSGVVMGVMGMVGVFIVVMCFISLIMMVVNLIVEQAQNAIVLEDMSLLAGLGRGWDVFRKYWLTIVVVGLILWVIGIAIGVVIALPIIAVAIPFAVGMGFATVSQNWVILVAVGLVCCAIFLPISLLLGGVENTYFQSVWTLAYRRLIEQMAVPAPSPVVENIEPQ